MLFTDGSEVLAGGDDETAALLRLTDEPGRAGAVQRLPRPLRTPAKFLIVGVGGGDEAGWRAAGAAAVRAVPVDEPLHVVLPTGVDPAAVRGVAEGIWFAAYRFRDAVDSPRSVEVTLQLDDPSAYGDSLAAARATATATWLARDLTNTPSSTKHPAWFAEQVVTEAAGRPDVTVGVREPEQLLAEGFGGLLAVGGGSATPPRLVELSYRPAGATRHIVLIGKGITFDTGGISIKTRDGMKLMKKDMGGAAAVVAAALAAADLHVPVRVTALAPLAENAVSGSAFRPGDVITQWDGSTTESTNSDAEGRLVLADVLAYAVAELAPDVVIDLATLTGANSVALGKRTAALYSHDDDLAGALEAAGRTAGEQMWRLPLPAEYREYLHSDIADRHSSPARGAGSVVAALFLSEFLGDRVDSWAHLDMSAPSWAEQHEGDLTRGATGWGARTLIRYLTGLSA
ncbi:M17 family metallopeptidase [Actinoplanes sp. N902-109]|uniref:leucyl aminopeptidase family protein n=1 Tax=Actinoplanes sp. (strain N902-109) TaxID=649831 RepID=UPI001E3F5F9E|nr:leucyl aminopeptidase family protein [Actinoplanes sp. N902-109]